MSESPACECPDSGGFCPRYVLNQSPHHVHLCRTSPAYQEKWARQKAEGRTPVPVVANPPAPVVPAVPGVGDHLKALLESVGIKAGSGCACEDMRQTMNALGVDGCRANRVAIVNHLEVQAKGVGVVEKFRAAVLAVATGLAFRLDPRDPFGSLVDEAIRRTVPPPPG